MSILFLCKLQSTDSTTEAFNLSFVRFSARRGFHPPTGRKNETMNERSKFGKTKFPWYSDYSLVVKIT